jgi:prepilin-type N-terminal cleavage/methylation domain-containing protein
MRSPFSPDCNAPLADGLRAPRRPAGLRGACAGFTLIEALVALVIVAVAGVALLRLELTSILLSDRATAISRAVRIADARMAEALARERIEVGYRSGRILDDATEKAFRWDITVAPLRRPELEEYELDNLLTVTARVFWRSGREERSVSLETYASP